MSWLYHGIIILVIVFITKLSLAQEPIRVAVLDSGIPRNFRSIPLCGAIDLTGGGLEDKIGHGTNISNLIHEEADGATYCQVIFKIFDNNSGGSTERSIRAFNLIESHKIDIVNYSAGGSQEDVNETAIVKELLDAGVIIVASAGNLDMNLDTNCSFFPACSDGRIITVGNGLNAISRQSRSNYGNYIKAWEWGENRNGGGYVMSGTSQAAAIKTGKLIKQLYEKKNNVKNK